MLKQKSLLWSVEDPHSNTLSYLYGTMHVQSNAAYDHIEIVKSVIKTKPFFFSETHLDDLAKLSQDQSMFAMPTGESLSDSVSHSRFVRWESMVDKHFGVDLKHFDQTLPFITLQFLQSHYLKADHSLPLDKYLWDYAKAKERVLGGLESVEFQANVLTQISLNLQIKMLKDFLSSPNKYKRQLLTLSRAYQNQEIYKLYQITNASLGRLRKLMLKDRNQRMATTIFKNKQNPSVYTFGAAHLAGRFGVLAYLKRHGLNVKAVTLKTE